MLRYREALWHGQEYLQDRPAFDLEYFPQMYRQNTQSTEGIRPPSAQTYIKQGGSGPNAGKAVYYLNFELHRILGE